MAIGATITPETRDSASWPAGQVAKKFMQRFESEIGNIRCSEIRHGLHWAEAKEYCDKALQAAVKIAVELIDEYYASNNPT